MSEGAVTHIAGPVLYFGSRMRQRCGWCGAALLDYDVTRVQVEVQPGLVAAHPVGTWEPGTQVRVDGHVSYVVESEASVENPNANKAPDDCCMRLDPEVTA